MRKKILIGNWKMNKTIQEAIDLMIKINLFINNNIVDCKIIIAPPFLYLNEALKIFNKKIQVSAQNMSEFIEGAYTGEISAKMLKSMNIDYVILGHSERRKYFREEESLLIKKINIALKYKITPIYCFGETLLDKQNNKEFQVNKKQIEQILCNFDDNQITQIIFAYEPIWSIGTGKTASPNTIQKMHQFVRRLFKERYSQKISNLVSILYGGSINSKNAKSFFIKSDIDGGLIGGSSLDENEFISIIKILSS